jgi:hypothetical protein
MARITPAKIADQYRRYVTAWEALAPGATFGKKTLAQFKAYVATSEARRGEVAKAEAVLGDTITDRDTDDDVILDIMEKVKKSVIDSEEFGSDDGALYEAMGYIPKSKRKTGNTRKKPVEP